MRKRHPASRTDRTVRGLPILPMVFGLVALINFVAALVLEGGAVGPAGFVVMGILWIVLAVYQLYQWFAARR